MATMQDFETALKEVVHAKRLSQSKVTKLTEVTMTLMNLDTQLVSTMYRTHKSLPVASKVSSLYVFDALARAARQQVVKHNLSERQATGNCATFLLKIAGVLDGLFQDMLATGLPEAKEKTKKIYDIWVKGSTFPPSILSRLSDILSGKDKESGVDTSSTSTTDPRVTTQANSVTSTKNPATSTSSDSQETLLALLTQAAGQQMQTYANTVASPTTSSADPTHILLQYLQSASVSSTAGSQISPTTSAPASDVPVLQNATDPRIPKSPIAPRAEPASGRHSPGRDRYRSPPRDDYYHERGYDDQVYSRSEQREQRGNFRWRGRGNRWDERDRNVRRTSNDASWGHRKDVSRSRSPDGRTRRKSLSFSPPRRRFSRDSHDDGGPKSARKDEFGRDLRSSSLSKSPSVPTQTFNSPPTTPSTPHDSRAEFPATSTNNDPMSISSPIAANTFSKDPNTSEMSAESNTNSLSQTGSNNFDISTFDPTSPASWEALGKMWEAMNGYAPSTEELMQFMMMGAMSQSVPHKDWQQESNADSSGTGGGRGGYGKGDAPRGRRGYGGPYGNSRNNHHGWTNSGEETNWQSTDAVVLGGDGADSSVGVEEYSGNSQPIHSEVCGGRMQKVGDRWVFVRNESVTS